jgi:hypothetical protein
MPKPNQNLIDALRKAAKNLKEGNHYEWGHHGSCNCGNLLQASTDLSKGEIIKYAQTGLGEWSELAEEYCEVTTAPFQMLIDKLTELGLTHVDIHNIEYLSDDRILHNLKGGFRHLERNQRQNVIDYFYAFADLLEFDLNAETEIASTLKSNLVVV